jgi:hypothetical protein
MMIAVVAEKDDDGLFPQIQLVERGATEKHQCSVETFHLEVALARFSGWF